MKNGSVAVRAGARVALWLWFVSTLTAHDFWIAPSQFSIPLEKPISLSLLVGDHFKGSVFPRQSSHIVSFQVTDPAGEHKPVPGLEGGNPAGFFRFTAPGLYVVSYRSNSNYVSLAPAKFRSYLREEGLERILELLPESDSEEPVREAFFRCAKALIVATSDGSAADLPGMDRRVGLPLELVADRSPLRLKGGGELALHLYFEERPLEGALIVAMQQATGRRLESRSDVEGEVMLELDPGVWLIKAVHMTPAAPDLDARWQSFWASLILEIPE